MALVNPSELQSLIRNEIGVILATGDYLIAGKPAKELVMDLETAKGSMERFELGQDRLLDVVVGPPVINPATGEPYTMNGGKSKLRDESKGLISKRGITGKRLALAFIANLAGIITALALFL